MYQSLLWQEQIKIRIIISLKNTLTNLVSEARKKYVNISSNLAAMFMLSIRQLFLKTTKNDSSQMAQVRLIFNLSQILMEH